MLVSKVKIEYIKKNGKPVTKYYFVSDQKESDGSYLVDTTKKAWLKSELKDVSNAS